MEEKIVKTLALENHQRLVITDMSRKISPDAFLVVMKATMEIMIKKALFEFDPLSEERFQDILDVLGDRIIYEYRIERNFIMDHEKDEVFDALVETYMKNLGQYVSKPQFPGKLVLKEYKDRTKK